MNILSKVAALAVLLPSCVWAQKSLNAQELFREVSASVVTVSGKNASGVSMQGSGVVIAPQVVVSNCHVIGGSEESIVAHMGQDYPATLMATNTERDLCLVRVPGIEARPVKIGASTLVEIGEPVFAVGAPQGLSSSISQGIVSGLRRAENAKLIQTTAAISHGSSGGGLFNANGDLIGITTLYLDDSQQLNFAVPAEWVSNLLNNPNRQPNHGVAKGGGRATSRFNGEESAEEAARAQAAADIAAADAAIAADVAADAAAAAADAAASAADDANPWVEVSTSNSLIVNFKKGTFEISKNKGGETIALALAQIFGLTDEGIVFRKQYVTAQDCRKGHGKLISLAIDGSYAGEVDYVSEGGTVASGIADTLCALYEATVNMQSVR